MSATDPPVRWALYTRKLGAKVLGVDPDELYMCVVTGECDTHAVLMEPSGDSSIVAILRRAWDKAGFERVFTGSHPNDAGMLAALRERGVDT